MASEFAQRLVQVARTPTTEWSTPSERLDAELLEVREVLEACIQQLQSLPVPFFSTAYPTLQRARELNQRLEIK